MRKLFFLLAILVTSFHLILAQNQIFPKTPSSWVNDYAKFFTGDEVNRLNAKLGAYEDSTSTQIFVVTLNETGGAEISMLASEIGQAWGVGQKGKENGVLMLIYPQERKVFIATGYGLEQYIPDGFTKRIIENEITPNFKKGNYYEGIDQATSVIMNLLSGKFTADQYRKKGNKKDDTSIAGIIFLIILFLVIFRSRSGGRSASLGRSVPFWIALGMLNGSRHSHGGSFGGFSSGSGGFGGFSGGGGGSFGGGGAGGSW